MSYTAEVAGKSADRYRAYTAAKYLRKPTADDYIKRAAAKQAPYAKGTRIRYDGEAVALEGNVTGATVSISTKPDVTITRVVFYKGPVETEVVVGSVDINAAGTIQIDLVEPADDVEIVDE